MACFKGLAHIGLFTEDIERSKSFYIDSFGFKLEDEITLDKPGNQWLKLAFISLNDMVIELLEPSDKTNVKRGNAGSVDHIAVKVENLQEIVDVLKKKEIVFETEEPNYIKKLDAQMIFLRGPSGERIELIELISR